jgi:hypothetical protein
MTGYLSQINSELHAADIRRSVRPQFPKSNQPAALRRTRSSIRLLARRFAA